MFSQRIFQRTRRLFHDQRLPLSTFCSGISSKFLFGASFAGFVVGAVSIFYDPNSKWKKFSDQSISLANMRASLVFHATDKIPPHGFPATKKERTFIAIKPDGVNRMLISEIISRFERKGYKLVAIKMLIPTKEFAEQHYDDLKTKLFFPSLVEYFSSGPVLAMIWEGNDVISGGRKLIGATNPAVAEPGSIRGDLCIQVGRNIIHGSDSVESAKHEINLWFTENEIANWDNSLDKWI